MIMMVMKKLLLLLSLTQCVVARERANQQDDDDDDDDANKMMMMLAGSLGGGAWLTARGGRLLDEELKGSHALSVVSVVFDVLGPSLALNIDECVPFGLLEVNHHKGRLVAGLVQEWIVLCFKAAARIVVNRSNVLLVWIVLALAGDLDVARREWGVSRIVARLRLIRFWFPAVDLHSFVRSFIIDWGLV